MRFRFVFIIVLSLVFFAGNAFAFSEFRFGYMPMFSYSMINDPDGSAAANSHFMPISAIVTYGDVPSFRDTRIFGHIYYDWFDVKGSQSNVGQKAKSIGANISWQWMFRLAQHFKPYVGIGVGYANEKYIQRYKTTASGLYRSNQLYPDRNVQSFSGIVNMSTQWSVTEKWDAGIHLQFEQPINGGSTAARAGIYVSY